MLTFNVLDCTLKKEAIIHVHVFFYYFKTVLKKHKGFLKDLKMCVIEFIVLPSEVPFGVCQYLLARFILFCFFGGLAICGSICSTEERDNACFFRLLVLAMGLELLGVAVALAYVAFALIIATELVCTILSLVCICCVFPLVNRAVVRRNLSVPMDHALISTTIIGIACDEACSICCDGFQPRVAPEGVAGGDVPVTTQNFMKNSVGRVFSAARVGINIV